MLVFVYGSLMSDMGNHHYLEKSTFIGQDTLELLMFDLGPFPGCIFGNGEVHGEVYDVDLETLQKLDILEGHPNLYSRCVIDTSYGPAYVYIINWPRGEFVSHGDWKLVELNKRKLNAF